MIGLRALWLPVLISSVVVFVASWLVHTVLGWHKGDYARVPDEDKVREALRALNIPPGDYMVPRAGSMKEMGSPEFLEKMQQGPNVIMTVVPNGRPSMGTNLAQWFVFLLVVGVFVAYVAGRANPGGAPYLHVFRFAGVTAFLAYGAAMCQQSIWYRRAWRTTFWYLLDALLYGLLTAGVFGWLWPR